MIKIFSNSITHNYFSEYILSAFQDKEYQLILYDEATIFDLKEEDENYFIQCIPNNPFLKGKVNFINTECLNSSIQWGNVIMNMQESQKRGVIIDKYYDYSKANLNRVFYLEGKYLRYKERKEETEFLRECSKGEIYDIAFCGTRCPRRDVLLSALSKSGYSVIRVEGFGDERDKLIGKCKVLLHINFEGYNVFPEIRCNRWLFAGKMVISENCEGTLESFPNLLLFDYNSLFFGIQDYFTKLDGYPRITSKF